MDGKRYAFNLTWYDRQADLYRPYQLLYWVCACRLSRAQSLAVGDDQIEMYDMRTRKLFLRRCACPSLKLKDIYLGNTVEMCARLCASPRCSFGRQMKVESYGDAFTTSSFSAVDAKSVLFVSSSGQSALGALLEAAERAEYQITNARSFVLSSQEASSFCVGRLELLGFFQGPVVALELLGRESNAAWSSFLSQQKASDVYVCKSRGESESDARRVFADRVGFPSATFDNCTLCLVKPHCFKDRTVGSVVSSIQKGGFTITALELFRMSRTNTEEFLEVYRGVSPDYQAMVDCITSGPCLALEIRAQDAVKYFREFCGPSDVDIAKHLRPNTLRAVYGTSRVLNAVHCTDLASDGTVEVRLASPRLFLVSQCDYFFNVLQRA